MIIDEYIGMVLLTMMILTFIVLALIFLYMIYAENEQQHFLTKIMGYSLTKYNF
jgi:hypothetical protein